jgi:hypothetical protein
MGGVFPSETSIFIVAAGVNGSALTAADKVVGEVTEWNLSGGEKDIESIPVIGGFVNKENPRSQFEVSFDVIIQNTAASTLDRWDTYKYGTTGTSANEGSAKAIFISSLTNGSTSWKTFAANNCEAVTWEPTMAADDMLRGTLTFKFAPTTELGVANLRTSALAYSTSFFNWS